MRGLNTNHRFGFGSRLPVATMGISLESWIDKALDVGLVAYEADKAADAAEDIRKAAEAQAKAIRDAAASQERIAEMQAGGDPGELISGVPNSLLFVGALGVVGAAVFL